MEEVYTEKLTCATQCHHCNQSLRADDQRILSVYDHEAICMDCKEAEEKKPDYEEISKQMIGQCLIDTEVQYGDPEGYCFHHFYPFKCE
jgi:hypothetical protein